MSIAEMSHSIARSAQIAAHRADMQWAAAVVDQERETLARVGAEREMLRAALAQFDPGHPLLKDDDLIGRVKNAAQDKYRSYKGSDSQDWRSIYHAADGIRYEYTPVKNEDLLRKIADLESANIQNHVEKHALREALRRVDKSHPLIRPDPEQNMLVAALRKAGLMAHSFGGYDAVAEAGRTFKYPESMLWGERESVLEEYPGEIEALEKRIAFLRNPHIQNLKKQQMQSPT